MSYTSGRTVKTARPAQPSTPAAATSSARRLVQRHLNIPGVTIHTRPDYDLTRARATVRTTITFPATADTTALYAAVQQMPGLIRSTRDDVAITVIRVS